VSALFEEAFQASPSDAVVARERARFLLSRGRLPEAARMVAERLESRDPELLVVGMEAMRRRGRLEDAYDLALKVREIDPKGACGLLAASFIAATDDNVEAAKQFADQAVERAPGSGWVRAARVELNLRLSDDDPNSLSKEARAALALQGELDMECLALFMRLRLLLAPWRTRRGATRASSGAHLAARDTMPRDRSAWARDAIDALVRDSPSMAHHLLYFSMPVGLSSEEEAPLVEAARKADPGSPLLEEAYGYTALADLQGLDTTAVLNGAELRLPGMESARAHFRAARDIDPRWWMSRDPQFPVPATSRALVTPVFGKAVAPLKAEFARTRR
jgi:hypothetical protein